MAATRSALAALLVTACLAQVAQADVGHVTATAAHYGSGAQQSGDLAAFFFMDGVDVDPTTPKPDLALRLSGDLIEALVIENQYYAGEADLGSAGAYTVPATSDPTFDDGAAPDRVLLEQGHLTLAEQQAGLQVHLVPAGGAATVPFSAHAEAGAFEALEAVAMTVGRFGEPQPLDEDARDDEAAQFWPILIDHPVVVHNEQSSRFSVQVTGDFVLEMRGATLQGRGRDRDVTLESGSWHEPVHPAQAPGQVYHQRDVLLRIFVTAGTLDLDVRAGSTVVAWASPGLAATPDGDMTLEGASGRLDAGQQARVLRGETYVLPPGNVLAFAPETSTLALDVREAPAAAAPNGLAFAGAVPVSVAATAVLALLGAIGLGALRRWGMPADLRGMEEAIERGRFAHAARLAKRVLRQRPDSEDAMLGRAIALAKHGRPAQAIEELHEHLDRCGATDGSLHYVLGASYLDVGRKSEARRALGEAVRRTPRLHAEALHLLGEPAARSFEVNGYV